MEMYATPKVGSYTFKTRNFDGSFNLFYTKVEILGETAKSYLVRLLSPMAGHPYRSKTVVRKSSVKVKREESSYDYSDAYWNK